MSIPHVEQILTKASETLSLDTPVGEDDGTELGDFVEDQRSLSPEESAVYTIAVTTILNSGSFVHKIMSQYNLAGVSCLNKIPEEQIPCMIQILCDFAVPHAVSPAINADIKSLL